MSIIEEVKNNKQHIIRFGRFMNGSWWDHKASNDANKEIYPILYTQLANNPNFVQNPGY
ncbi:hypothetical protein D3C87_507870 [compost metagenome]